MPNLSRLVQAEPGEGAAFAWAALYFFSLLCGYYVIRPLRDEMGVAGGVENLQWMFTATFVAMLAAVPLFGWVTSRYPRRRFVPFVYAFFVVNLLGFFSVFRTGGDHEWTARAFFVWASVYNLFIVSVFWSLLNDVFSPEQARRLFAPIAAGGTAGAIAGPALTAALAVPLGPTNLLLVSALMLGVAVLCVHRLVAWSAARAGPGAAARAERPLAGGVVGGLKLLARSPYLLGICALVLLVSTLATFLYFQQAHIVRASFDDPGERTRVFALVDLAVNALTLATQLLVTGRLVRRFGVAPALSLVPALLVAGFVAIAVAPVLAVVLLVQVARRAGGYAVLTPSREMLFSVVAREEKYKAKNVIDTVVFRAGDAVSAWAYAALGALEVGLAGAAWVAAPIAALCAQVAWRLGRACEARGLEPDPEENPP